MWCSRVRKTATIAAALVAICMMVPVARANVQSQVHYARGLMAFNKGQWEQAFAAFDQAVKADPADAWSVYYRGLTHGKRGAATAAIADMEKALALHPDLPHAPLDLGIAYLEAGRAAEAKAWLEKAYLEGSERRVSAFFLGLAAYRLGNNTEATKYLTEAQSDPEVRAAARYYNGLALIRQRRGAAARSELEKAVKENPDAEMASVAKPYLEESQGAPSWIGGGADKPWSVTGKLGIEYDSNVIAGPSDDPAQRPAPKPTPLPGSKTNLTSKGDGRAVISAGGTYRIVDNDLWSLAFGGEARSSVHFSLNEFDLLAFPLWMEVGSHWGEIRYGLAGEWHYFLLDYDSFYQEGLVTPWVSFPETEGLEGQIYYTFRGRDFFEKPYNPGRDGYNHAVGIRQQADLTEIGLRLTGGLQYDKEDTVSDGPMGREFQYSGYQFDVGATYNWMETLQVHASYLFRLEDYDHPNSFAGAPTSSFEFRRHDNAHFFLIGSQYAITENVALTADFLAIVNGSNIENFEYDRFIVSPGVRVRF